MTRYSDLEDLLIRLFSAEELRRLVLRLPESERIAPRLPGALSSPAEFTHQTVQLLRREGILHSDELRQVLLTTRPHRQADIENVLTKFTSGSTNARPSTRLHEVEPAPRNEPPAPCRLLFVSASPRGSTRLAIDREARHLLETLKQPGRVELVCRPAADYDTLEAALVEHRPQILHLSCHGDPAGNLYLADALGDRERIRPAMFVGLISILRGTLDLVVLNACHSHIVASQLPPTLPAAIGMRNVLDDHAAIDFARTLYRNLAADLAIAEAFALASNKLHKYGAEELPQLFQR